MGKKEQHKGNLRSANGQTKTKQPDAATNVRAKKRQCSTNAKHKANGSDVFSAKRPKTVNKKTNAFGWVVESGECHLSKEGTTETVRSTRSPKLQTATFKGKRNPNDNFDSDESEWSTEYEFDSQSDEEQHDAPWMHRIFRNVSDDDDDDSFDSSMVSSNDSSYPPVMNGKYVIYDLEDDAVQFDPSCSHAQIVEIPFDSGSKEVDKSTEIKQAENGEGEKKEPDDVDSEESNSTVVSVPSNAMHWEYKFYNAIDLRMSLVILKAPIYMAGHLDVQVLCGKIEMMGYWLNKSDKKTVYASGGYNAISIIPKPSTDKYSKDALEHICKKLKPHFIASDIDELVQHFNPEHGVLLLLQADMFNARGTVPLVCELLPDFNLFPTSLTLDQTSPYSTMENLLEIAVFLPEAKDVPLFRPNAAWDAVQLKPDTRLMVVGGKGSGKSTLCQYMINRHIKHFGRILLVDLDIGQPLLFLPETISASVVQEPILGVGCFANVQPHKSYLFGSLNVVSSPLLYVQIVRSLVQFCAEHPELKCIPWIINTMGYVVGFGEELTTAIVRIVQPTDLVQLQFSKHTNRSSPFNKSQNYANQLEVQRVNDFKFNILHEEVMQQPKPVQYSFYSFEVTYEPCKASFFSPRRRTIAIMAQLVKILGDTADSFADVKPHMAPVNDMQILITRDGHRPSEEMLPRTLNATLVYLCGKAENGQYHCFGAGIVRSVDCEKKNLYLLHSLPPEQLANTNVLALCNTSLPSQVYLQLSPNIEGTIPYLQNVSTSNLQAF
uniref:Polynucleotide 5'-hydroxyl-kinase NOL9 n=1 Tax=Anopheles minimus TaxID=112268 RepID=A0A182WAE5_9DIPT